MKLCLEVRSRLRVANVILLGSQIGVEGEEEMVSELQISGLLISDLQISAPPSTDNISITAHGSSLTVDGAGFNCPGLRFAEAGLALGRRSLRDGGWFRLQLEAGVETEDGGQVELLESPDLYPRSLKIEKPGVELGVDYSLSCTCCQAELGRLRPLRLLPLPSSGWRQQTQNWFCCVNKLDAPPPVSIQRTDVLYGAGVCVLHRDVVHQNAVVLRDPVIKCGGCDVDLGLSVEDTLELWTCGVQLIASGPPSGASGPLIGACNGVSGPPGGAQPSSWNLSVRTPWDNCVQILRALIEDSTEIMPRFQLVAPGALEGDLNRFLVWVVDKSLSYFTSCDGSALLVGETVSKVLVKEGGRGAEPNFEEVRVSRQMLSAAKTAMLASCEAFPAEFKFVNGFQVAYLHKL